jgi:predicted nucleic acid-binding protein
MIFLDSWIWLEFLFDGAAADDAESVIAQANASDEGVLIAPTVLTEVFYRLRSVDDESTADEAIRAIRDYEHVQSMPIIDEIAEYAADLRFQYYNPGARELSYADAIHLATAVLHDECHALYSGDPDFEGIDEIDTVVL